MTIYIVQGSYTRDGVVGMVNKPEDRAEAVAPLIRAVGGKLLDYFVTFGDADFMVIVEGGKGKSETDTMAALMVAAATGGVCDLKTTVAVRSKEATKAMRVAKKVLGGFRAAGQPV